MKQNTIVCALAMALALSGGASDTSAPEYVSLDTETTSFWRTAPDGQITVRWQPVAGKAAQLKVTGFRHSATYGNLQGDSHTFDLPALTGAADENLYWLELQPGDGTVLSAQVARVVGQASGGTATAVCKDPASAGWPQFMSQAVVPIPQGATGLTVDGEAVDSRLDGAAGWYALGRYRHPADVTVGLTIGGESVLAELAAQAPGFLLLFR